MGLGDHQPSDYTMERVALEWSARLLIACHVYHLRLLLLQKELAAVWIPMIDQLIIAVTPYTLLKLLVQRENFRPR